MEQHSLIVIPTYNESKNIEVLIDTIFRLYPLVNVLVVDGNSNDGTQSIVSNLSNTYNNLHLYVQASKNGLGGAYLCGFKIGLRYGYRYFIQMDADLSHHPKYISTMLECLESNDVVIGSRNIKGGGIVGWGMYRKIISYGGSLYARLVLGVDIKDFTGGFNAYTNHALLSIDIDSIASNGYCFQIEMKYKAHLKGLKIKEFPIIFEDRVMGKSKMSKAIIIEALYRTILLRIRACLGL